MTDLVKVYGEKLITVFDGSKLNKEGYEALAVLKTGSEKKEIPGVLTMNYDEDFESLLNYRIPAKTRKPAKLLPYGKTMEMIERLTYATIGCVIDEMAYTYPINHVLLDGHIYFHTGRKGYKLNALNTKVSVSFVEDLGMAYNGTHNFRCAQAYGTLVPNEDHDTKEKVFRYMIEHLNPNHPKYVESMQQSCLMYELDVDYILGRENLFLPGDGK